MRSIIATFLAAGVIAGGGYYVDVDDSTLSGPLNASGQDIIDLDDIYQNACMATDAAPTPVTTITSECVYPGIGATNTAGADLVLAPAPGAYNKAAIGAVTRAKSTGDSITFNVLNMEGVVATPTTITEGDGTLLTFDCDGAASDAACVCNLYAAIVAQVTTITVARTNATCSDELLAFFITPGTSAGLVVTTADGAADGIGFGAITAGLAGQVLVPGGTAGAPSISTWSDPDTGLLWLGGNFLQVVAGGTARATITGTSSTWAIPLNMTGNYVYSSSQILALGAAVTSTHSLGTGAVGVGTGGLEVDGPAYFDSRVVYKSAAFADGDATPDVSGGSYFTTPSNTAPTVITDLDLPAVGQVVTICIGNATNPSTIANAGNFALSAAWNPGIDDCITLYVQADNDYIELSRVDN